MKFSKSLDFLLNVILPLLLGCFVYLTNNSYFLQIKINNYLPDALWAWSFISVFLIIWNRKLPLFWLIMSYLLSAAFEWLQYIKAIPGTGDSIDIMVYFFSISVAIWLNPYFRNKYAYKPINKPINQ